jgi:hypothetical protein
MSKEEIFKYPPPSLKDAELRYCEELRRVKVIGLLRVYSYDDSEKSYVLGEYNFIDDIIRLPRITLNHDCWEATEAINTFINKNYGFKLEREKWRLLWADTSNQDVFLLYEYEDEEYNTKFRELSDFLNGLSDPRLQVNGEKQENVVWIDATGEYDDYNNLLGMPHLDDFEWGGYESDKEIIKRYA